MDPWQLRPARDLGMSQGERLASTAREPGLIEGMGQRTWAVLVRCYLRICHRLTVHGRERLPTQLPFVLIGNHTSHLDALVLSSLAPWRLRRWLFPIAAGDVFFETPARSALSALLLNALPMRRKQVGRHALDELRARLLQDPCGFVLFPEGTRSATGELQPFKAGLGMLVAGTGVPVVPCHLEGAFTAWPRHARLPRPGRIVVRVGTPLVFAAEPNTRPGWERIANVTAEAVRQLGATSIT